ncbi:mate-domain-containing protein [Radiomyces spectabilis]|uniref:mate-domain-containing protein n=1 Tax=Radiomyces spectabilis TaxID=64574 RepID=UPI002220CB4A|nr:mate-domain-containing protein [Radiomyces spectabilis]KAI8388515.1 mate-domain-containing protein [Radiomyces spectabilis]
MTREHRAGSIDSSLSQTPTERSPLLPSSKVDENGWSTEFKWLLKNSLPVIGTYLLQNSLQMASIFTLGHLGPTELAASALASMFASVSAWSLAFGTTTALDTLCSQAWTGAHDKTLVGVHLQRALLILAVMFLPIAVVWWNATRILLALDQEPGLALHAGLFLRYLLLGAPAFIAFEAIKKFLQAQGIMQASTYVLMFTSPLNLAINYMFVYVEPFKMGFIGAPLATSISYWVMLLSLLAYIKFVDGRQAWGGWTREALTGWWPFLRLAIPGILMVCTEWWAFELAALAASYLGTIDLAAQSILLTSNSATYTIPYGISVAASNRVGNALGEGLAQKARRASFMALMFAIGFGALNSTFFLVTRSHFGYLFTSDLEVVQRVSYILPLCALFQIADGLAGVCGGVIRGLGRQKVAAWINLFAYYVVAIPLGFYLTFKANWSLIGLWTGLSVALFIGASGECLFLFMVDWYAEVKRTQDRVHKEEDKHHHILEEA